MSSRHHPCFLISAALGMAFLCLPADAQTFSNPDAPDGGRPVQEGFRHPVMHPDLATRELWRSNHMGLPHTAFDPMVQHRLAASVQSYIINLHGSLLEPDLCPFPVGPGPMR